VQVLCSSSWRFKSNRRMRSIQSF